MIGRADVSGITADGRPHWNTHTAPLIDQSQTYGSDEQILTLLREWVKDSVTGVWHAGAKMFDGLTVKEWTKAFGETTTAIALAFKER